MFTNILNGYSIEWKDGGYFYVVPQAKGAAKWSRKKYPTHCMARMAATRYQKAHA